MSKNIIVSLAVICMALIFMFNVVQKNNDNILCSEYEKINESVSNSQQSDRNKNRERKYKSEDFQAGINVVFYEHPSILNCQKLFKHLREMGINSVAIVFPFFQSDWQADQVTINSAITPTIPEIKGLILSAHSEELSVMLRPILDEKSFKATGHWRGTIRPKNLETWFNSYRSLILMYAELAQKTNVEIFNIGTELNSLQHNRYNYQWLSLIKNVKEIYQGKLIYSFNWDCFREIPSIKFVSMLDYIGIDAYFPLDAPNNADVKELEKAWKKWMDEIKKVSISKPIIITEAGIIPVKGAYRIPYEWNIPGGKLDMQAQVNYYNATYSVWKSMIHGIYWWGVTGCSSKFNNIDYSPIGKPAENVIKQLFLKKSYQNNNS